MRRRRGPHDRVTGPELASTTGTVVDDLVDRSLDPTGRPGRTDADPDLDWS